MTPLHFMSLSNRYQYEPEQGKTLNHDTLDRCRKAMAGAVGGGRGQFVSPRVSFSVCRIALGTSPCDGGVWRLIPPEGDEVARLAICRDPRSQAMFWTAVHVGWDTIVSRPVNTPPRLPWSVNATGFGITSWGGVHRLVPGAPDYLSVAWWQLYEAGALGD